MLREEAARREAEDAAGFKLKTFNKKKNILKMDSIFILKISKYEGLHLAAEGFSEEVKPF